MLPYTIEENTLIIRFPGPRRVVSTARFNGGYREDLKAVFNHHMPPHAHDPATLPGGSLEGYFHYLVDRLGLPREHTAGLFTAAHMENASFKTLRYRELEVSAIVTAGVDVNGGRAGDPAQYYEIDGQWIFLPGTINIILLIEGHLPPFTLVRALVTATEAKASALQELMAPSRYSRGIATGSGTDQMIAVANPQSPHVFTDAGKHSKLGELIGVTVKEAVKEALDKETGLSPKRQQSFLVRLERYGWRPEDFWRQSLEEGLNLTWEEYQERLRRIERDPALVTLAASLVHVCDEYAWGLLPAEGVLEAGCKFIQGYLGGEVNLPLTPERDPEVCLGRWFISLVNRVISGSPR